MPSELSSNNKAKFVAAKKIRRIRPIRHEGWAWFRVYGSLVG